MSTLTDILSKDFYLTPAQAIAEVNRFTERVKSGALSKETIHASVTTFSKSGKVMDNTYPGILNFGLAFGDQETKDLTTAIREASATLIEVSDDLAFFVGFLLPVEGTVNLVVHLVKDLAWA